MEQETLEKTKLSPYSKLKVEWSDLPENYSKEAKNKIINAIAKKYGVQKNNVKVIYYPVKFNEKGDVIHITGAGIENIMDVNYQRALMKEVIKRDNKVVDFNRIIALDEKVNGELNIDLTESQHKSWSIKWIMIDNFLSFGENNYVSLTKLKGLTIVNSLPENMGGKTTLTIDAIEFLLYGTTSKTDKNEQIFNLHSGKNELVVRGMIDIEGEETIIERKMKRSVKKDGGWNVTNKVNYYKILPDGEEDPQNEEDAARTTKKLRETLGTEKDFEMLVLATEKNLDELVGLTTTESGKVITRLIGLEILEMKEGIVRTMYNEFSKKKKSNEYDVITLENDIVDHKQKIELCITAEISLSEKLETAKTEIITLSGENDRLLNSKEKIDVTITTLNPSKLTEEIATITTKGVSLGESVKVMTTKITELGEIKFDEDRHHELTKLLGTNNSNVAVKNAEITRLKKQVADLIAGGICQSCNRKLDDVDNTPHIQRHEETIKTLSTEVETITGEIDKINVEIAGLNTTKKLIDDKNKLELDKDRTEVEIGSLRNQIVAKRNDLNKYNLNLAAIEMNKKIDAEVSIVKTKIAVSEHTKEETSTKLQKIKFDKETHKTSIETKTKLIDIIKKEEEVDRIYRIYIDLVGKKGVSKLVLRSVLPIINSEVQRLLEDVCDFEIEIFIDDKNDVQFHLIRDGVIELLKSGSGFEKTAASLALRSVLAKLSTLPMPNFITFDEVLGKVHPNFLEKLKPLFDKIKDMYDIVFLITHNDIVKDWGDNIVTVIKENKISRLTLK